MTGIISGLLGIGCLVLLILSILYLYRGLPKTSDQWFLTTMGTAGVIFGYLFGSAWIRYNTAAEWPKWPFVTLDKYTFGADE